MARCRSLHAVRTAEVWISVLERIIAISVTPSPMSTSICAYGDEISRPAPNAAAIGSGTTTTAEAPARFVASIRAARSSSQASVGAQVSARGLIIPNPRARLSIGLSSRYAASTSATTPAWQGETESELCRLAVRRAAFLPTASTLPVSGLILISEGSSAIMPWPRAYSLVFAVPSSRASSGEAIHFRRPEIKGKDIFILWYYQMRSSEMSGVYTIDMLLVSYKNAQQ